MLAECPIPRQAVIATAVRRAESQACSIAHNVSIGLSIDRDDVDQKIRLLCDRRMPVGEDWEQCLLPQSYVRMVQRPSSSLKESSDSQSAAMDQNGNHYATAAQGKLPAENWAEFSSSKEPEAARSTPDAHDMLTSST